LPKGEPVGGVTVLDNQLYVLRRRSEDQVEVYDTDTYTLQRRLTVPGLGSIADMASCMYNNCLYISDWFNSCVHRVETQGSITQWPINGKPYGLSITAAHNVLVTCREACKLKEFTTRGKMLREISLQPDVVDPWHALELTTDQFLVCHGDQSDPVHRVCLVSADGRVTMQYGGLKGSAAGELDLPTNLAVDKDGFIFVVDHNNRRVIMLSPALNYVLGAVTPYQLGLRWAPFRLCLDVERGRLYMAVGEWKDGEYVAGQVVVVEL
jgi:sugar lactone lactonase YvrE